MAVSVAQAALNALSAYLTTALTGTVTVRSYWPAANASAVAKAITIIQAGAVIYDVTDLQAIATTNVSTSQVNATWAVYQCRMPIQLDIWARTDIDRDDLRAQLDTALNKGLSILSTTADLVAEGLSLSFLAPDGYTGTIAYLLDDATLIQDAAAYQRSEYRATIRGEARFCQTQQTSGSRLVGITIKEKAHEGSPAPSSELNDIVTVLPGGATSRTTGP